MEGREQLRKKNSKSTGPRLPVMSAKGFILTQQEKEHQLGTGESVVEGVLDFVAPSSSGLVRMSMQDITAIYRELAQLIKKGT